MSDIIKKTRHLAYHSKLLWKNRSIIPSVAAGYFNRLVLKKNVLRTLEVAITPHCNVNCSMCYATKIVDRSQDMLSPAEYAKIWQQAKALGAFSVHLSGGEPTIRKDLFEVIAAFEPNKTLISMTTNASRMSNEFLRKLYKAGVTVLHFSLNSTDPEANDAQRDYEGHHESVLDLIDKSKAVGFEVCLSIVVAHTNLDEVRRLTEFAIERDIGIVFSLATPAGNWTGYNEELLTEDDWAEVDAYMKSTPNIRADWTVNLSMKTECPAGFEKISISPYGDVQGCAMSFISHGNIREEPVESIWRRMHEYEPYKKRSSKCLIGLDRDYIDNYLAPINKLDILPVRAEKHPSMPLGGGVD